MSGALRKSKTGTEKATAASVERSSAVKCSCTVECSLKSEDGYHQVLPYRRMLPKKPTAVTAVQVSCPSAHDPGSKLWMHPRLRPRIECFEPGDLGDRRHGFVAALAGTIFSPQGGDPNIDFEKGTVWSSSLPGGQGRYLGLRSEPGPDVGRRTTSPLHRLSLVLGGTCWSASITAWARTGSNVCRIINSGGIKGDSLPNFKLMSPQAVLGSEEGSPIWQTPGGGASGKRRNKQL
jgi:hypothetical protein